ncbi:hypothetical protein QWY84_07795 [Aquisalimonas lutea]|uniref:hypothetical protein n=1 Tax=Aquisalimonas lutea TaxID=1327750 RepID=UPI0025B36AED|nr:hypothetical protein [Aquisalimonas lutea]MDN3517506.1 hypothetical protein [Aquisalimonas lutea]
MAEPTWSERATISELLCVPFLDSGARNWQLEADAELIRRGMSRMLIPILRRVCAIGLWTQYLAWEEWHLDLYDVLFGYGVLFLGAGVAVSVFGFMFAPLVGWFGGALFLMGACLAVAGWRGYGKGTRHVP